MLIHQLDSISNEIPYFGIEAKYDDDFDKCDIPCGSEGTLVISTWVTDVAKAQRFTRSGLGIIKGWKYENRNYYKIR